MAISVHQANDTSSDFTFTVRLHDDPPPHPQVGQFVVDGSPTALNASSNNIGNWIDQGGLIFQMDGGDNTIRTETLDVSGLTNVNVAFTFRALKHPPEAASKTPTPSQLPSNLTEVLPL
ncbi:MAG: hypothetical protein R3F11_01150 [Verrucomicrobiales bacterium]